MIAAPVRLEPSFHERVWGSTALMPWFPDSYAKIGEVWFSAREHIPLLFKFIFTTERLSVQVHPGDDYAARHENSAGKTEMWHILHAEPGATIALGFKQPIDRERLREASLSGEIEQLLQWMPVRAGQTFFTPAGTVHAIGAGIVLCEIQQHSDITYRLYDYGRPRKLHIERGVEVAQLVPHPGVSVPTPLPDGAERLVTCRYFHTDRLVFDRDCTYQPARAEVLIVLGGCGRIAGQPFAPGQAWLLPAGCPAFTLCPESQAEFIRTCAPPQD